MSVRTDKVQLIVDVNGNTALNNLNEMRKKAADIRTEMQGLKKNTEEYKNKAAELKKVNSDMDALKKTIGLTSLSQKELVAELNKLKALKGSVQPFTKEFKDLQGQIEKVEKRLYDVKNGVQGFSSFFSKIGDQVKQFGVLAAGYLGFQFITSQFQNIISGAGKLSDQLADLRRVAGLTATEAENLNRQLSGLDTRTSTSGLREIAIIAGKLGVAKNDLFDFTKAVDQLVVALGDELGDASTITDTLGKILNVFDGKVNGDNITRLGNAFVELANAGVASGGFIADFDQRLSGIAKTANIGVGELSGLGAGIQELGGRVESSSTAIQKLIVDISTDLPKAAKIAGIEQDKFNQLFGEKPTETLLLYAQGLVKNKQSFSEITAAFKEAGIDGARAVETITKLATNAEFLRTKIDLGAKAFKESGAITEAFRLKNETLGATLDKIGKAFNAFISNSALNNSLKSLAQGFYNLIAPTKDAVQEFDELAASTKSLQDRVGPLIIRYDELKGKTTLNKDEQNELNAVIAKIVAIMPDAADGLNKYGTALDINRDKVSKFLEENNKFLQLREKGAIDELVAQAKKTTDFITLVSNARNKSVADALKFVGNTNGIQRFLSESDVKLAQSQDKLLTIADELKNKFKTDLPESFNEYLKAARAAKFATDEVTAAVTNAGNSGAALQQNIGLIKKLQDQIKKLDDARPNLNSEAEIRRNIEQRKKLQEELDRLEGREQKKSSGDKDAEQRKKQLKDLLLDAQRFEEELRKIKNAAYNSTLSQNEQEVIAIQEKYKELLRRAERFHDALLKMGVDNSEQLSREEIEINKAKWLELNALAEKNLLARKKAEELLNDGNYKAALESQRNNNSQLLQQLKQQLLDGGFKDRKEYEAQVAAANLAGRQNEVAVAEKWAAKSKLAAKDLAEFKKILEAEGLDAAIAAIDARLAAEKEATEKTKEEKQKQLQAIIDFVDSSVQYAQAGLNIVNTFNQATANKENAALARDRRINDEKKRGFQKLLDQKLISQEQYNLKVQKADEELALKERQLRRKQAEREKQANTFQALINTFSAIAEALPNIPLSIAAGVLGFAQVAAIQSQELPELGLGDWIRNGLTHKQGGINANIEKNEAVIAARTMTDPNTYTVTGTPAQITSALQGANGARTWAGGAVISMPDWYRRTPPGINSSIPQIMKNGGVLTTEPNEAKQSVNFTKKLSGDVAPLLQELILEQRRNTEEIKTMKTKLRAVVSRREFDKEEKEYNAAKAASGF